MPKRLSTRSEMLHEASKKPWEVVIDGDMGRDIVGAYPCWKDAHKALKTWLKGMSEGKLDEEEEDNKEISDAAKMEDKWALKSLKNAVEDERWSFRFRHDHSKYTICLQPVGYKE